MKILYIHTGVISDRDVADTLQKMGWELEGFSEPSPNVYQDKEYADALLCAIEEKGINIVFSLRYFPVVSIVCNAVKVTYLSWVCASYEPGVYSCTLLNECNYIFLADYALYQEFSSADFLPVFYLPMGANVDRIKKVLEKHGNSGECGMEEYETDVTMPQDIIPRQAMPLHPLSAESPLKDAAKGYLEGCIACQHQLSGLPSMAEHLPAYVWDELRLHFAPEIGADSIESAAHYYDYQYFNPLITYADREIHLNALAQNKYFRDVVLYQDYPCGAEKIRVEKRADYRAELPLIVRRSRINLVVAHRNWKSAIPQISWDIMASGGFLISNAQPDFFRLFPDCAPVLYTEERELLSKAIYYLHHDRERRDLAQELAWEVAHRHTIRQRLEMIFSSI